MADQLDQQRWVRPLSVAQMQRGDGEHRQRHDRPATRRVAAPAGEDQDRDGQRGVRPGQQAQGRDGRRFARACRPVHERLRRGADDVRGGDDDLHRARGRSAVAPAQDGVHDHRRQKPKRAVGRGHQPRGRLAAGKVADGVVGQPNHVPEQAEHGRQQRQIVELAADQRQQQGVQRRAGQKPQQVQQRREGERRHAAIILPQRRSAMKDR